MEAGQATSNFVAIFSLNFMIIIIYANNICKSYDIHFNIYAKNQCYIGINS